MRFFGSKSKKRDGQQHAASSGEGGAEVRTDVTSKKDHHHGLQLQQQPVSAVKVKAPTSTSPRVALGSNHDQLRLQPQQVQPQQQQQQQQRQPTSPQTKSNGVQSTATATTTAVRPSTSINTSIGIGRSTGSGLSPRSLRGIMTSNSSSPQNNARPMATTTAPATTSATTPQLRLSTSPKQASTGNGAGAKANAPTSILHRKKHVSPTNATATNKKNGQQTPPPPMISTANTTSFDISPLPVNHNPRVRFMSSGSVASTEASQVHLMAGAAGSVASSSAMSSVDPNHRDNVFDRVLNMVMAEEHERLSAMGMSRADPKSDAVKLASKKKKAVAATATTPPVVVVEAPRGGPALELDTSMDVEYHDRNDEGVPEERWTKLNDAAIASGMQNLSFDSSNSSHQGSDSSPSHSRLRRGINMMKGHQPTNEGKKMKKTDLKPDDWVDFDNKNNSEGSKRNEKSGTIRRVNDLASF